MSALGRAQALRLGDYLTDLDMEFFCPVVG
jgi:hypothetical protein